MPLKMRPTGLGHGVYKDSIDYSVFSGEWEIERKGFPEDVRFFWSLHGICSDQAAQHTHRWACADAGGRES
jgi:hypothetical protein